MANIKKVELCVGGKTIGTIDVPNPNNVTREEITNAQVQKSK